MGRRVRKFDGPSGRGLWLSPLRAMSIKSALRIHLSVSYGMIGILVISHLRWLFPPPFWWRPPPKGDCIFSPAGRLYGFRRQRRHKKWRQRRRTSPVGTVSQPIGKPFNGQAKGLLWLTWKSSAGPPQYFIPPEGESPQPACKAKPITGRTLGAQGQRPGGAINPHAHQGVSTFGNTAFRRFFTKTHGFPDAKGGI